MSPEHKKLAAELNDFLSYAAPDYYQEVLTELWEGWLTSPDSAANDCRQRAEKLEAFKKMKQILAALPGG